MKAVSKIFTAAGAVTAFAAVTGAIAYCHAIIPKRVPKTPTDEKRIARIDIRKRNNDYLYSHNPEDLELVTDGLKLRTWFVPAKEPSKRFVICIHGYNCNGPDECSHLFGFYHDVLGYNYFLPDLRGHGRSEGNAVGFGALDSKDIKLWIDYLVNRFGEDIEIIIHGISMGAATAMLVNSQNPPPQVKLIIEDCGFTNALEEMMSTVKTAAGYGFPLVMNLGNIFCRLIAGYDLKKDADPLGKMKDAVNPVLFIHGSEDTFVPTYMCHELYDACPTPKDKLIVEGAMHAYSYYDGKEEYEKKVTEFIDKHIGL